jgi:hypothetical protein
VVTAATLVVIAAAIAEVLVRDTIALWTGVALVTVSVIAALVTRAGDRSLPAMMPPLAFFAAALIAGQLLVVDESGSLRRREVLMLAEVLGSNATWVVAATVAAVSIALVRHLVDR